MAQMVLLNVYQIDGITQSPSLRTAFPVQQITATPGGGNAVSGVNMYGLVSSSVLDGARHSYGVRETVSQIATAANA